jgi:hypothetical protein
MAGETEAFGENCSNATLSTISPTWPGLGSNPVRISRNLSGIYSGDCSESGSEL